MTRARWLRLALSLAISGCFVLWSVRDKDLAGAVAALRGADFRWLVPYVAIMAAIHLCRVLRWGSLLRPQLRLGFGRLNRAFAVGTMAVVILPFRLGEVARPLLVAGRGAGRTPFSRALATVVVERVGDGLAIAAILLVSLLLVEPAGPEQAEGIRLARISGLLAAAVFGGALVALVVGFRLREAAPPRVEAILGRLSPRLGAAVARRVSGFLAGLQVLPGAAGVGAFVLYTGVYWAINALSMVVLGRVFGLELSMIEGCTILGLLVVALMIPAGPGMVGTFQTGVLVALALFVPREVATSTGVAYANLMWLLQFSWQVGVGLVFLAAGGSDELSLRELWSRAMEGAAPEEPVPPVV